MAELLRFPSAKDSPALEDAAARERALDTQASFVVEAPAGSGKTGLLLQRFLKLLADPAVAEPEEVLAITFTNKAAAELRERVLVQLSAADRNAPLREGDEFQRATRLLAEAVLDRDRTAGWGLLERPQRLNLRTIDSVCAEIANSMPLVSGAGAQRQPVEDAWPLYRLAAERTLFQLGGNDRPLHEALRTLLLHRDGSLRDCEALLASMLAQREQWGELVPLDEASLNDAALDSEVRPRLERALESIVCAGLSRALRSIDGRLLEDLSALASALGLEPANDGGASPIAICADRRVSPQDRAEDLEHWVALIHLVIAPSSLSWRSPRGLAKNHLRFELPKAAKAELQRILADLEGNDEACDALCGVLELPPPHYPDEQWHVAKALFHVLRRALAELKVLFAERGECDFTELALAARTALRADDVSPDVALALGGRLRHLLVDEMQDTSAGQYELLDLLTRSWDGHTQTLFLVGDPKQSIYLFRQARVERFLRTMREGRLGEITLTPLRLTANFRSQAALVHAFNQSFSTLFPPPEEAARGALSEVPFVAATAVRERTDAAAIQWHARILPRDTAIRSEDEEQPIDVKRQHELRQAREIRRTIEQWQRKPLPPERAPGANGKPKPWRIAVLVRARHHLNAIAAELKREYTDEHEPQNNRPPIRYRAVDIEELGERPEVLDALALTRALLHPADRVAWLAVLHAPWCGLGLADLLALTGEGAESDPYGTVASLVASRRHLLSAQGQALLDRAWPVLATAAANIGTTAIDVHVERTWRSLGGDAPLNSEQRQNVLRFLGVLRGLAAETGRVELEALQARLHALYAEPSAGDITVELMTMHKAKGLEWDLVLVPGLERAGQRDQGELLNWLELDAIAGEDTASIVLAPIRGKGSESDKLNKWLNSVKEAREHAERKRLFYVTCTRAREELHLFAACSLKNNGELAQPAHGSLLKSCWPAAEEAFAKALAAQPAPAETQEIEPVSELTRSFARSLAQFDQELEEIFNEPFSIAASTESGPSPRENEPPVLYRLPSTFDPRARFSIAQGNRLPYVPAAALPQAPAFDRPEGSYAARAFGNVVHRFLQLLADRMKQPAVSADVLLAELSSWEPRVAASLRGEGLPPSVAQRQAPRALEALTHALRDEKGRWVLSPHPQATSERPLTLAANGMLRSLRADRTFLAAATPLSVGDTHLWILDFKTAEQGSRDNETFIAGELAKYREQLEAYAVLRRAMPGGGQPIMLALYYPLASHLIHWPAAV